MPSFDKWMKARQAKWRRTRLTSQEHGKWGIRLYAHILPKDLWEEGLWPGIGSESENSLLAYLQRTGVQSTNMPTTSIVRGCEAEAEAQDRYLGKRIPAEYRKPGVQSSRRYIPR